VFGMGTGVPPPL